MKKKNIGELAFLFKENLDKESNEFIKIKTNVFNEISLHKVVDLFNLFLIRLGFSNDSLESYYSSASYNLLDSVNNNIDKEIIDLKDDLEINFKNNTKEKKLLLADNNWIDTIISKINNNQNFAKKIIAVYIDYLFNKNKKNLTNLK